MPPTPPPSAWKCIVCWKLNADDRRACGCCGRDRRHVPTSLVDDTHERARPLALHGLATAGFPFRAEQLAALAAHGLDLTEPARDGWTPLHCAARLGQDEVVEWLLVQPAFAADGSNSSSSSVALEAATRGGWRALHHATVGGHLRVVEVLLVAGAAIDARLDPESQDGLTPLHLAAAHGHEAILELLLQCGADPHAMTSQRGRSALHLAIDAGAVACVGLLAAVTDLVLHRDREGLLPLQQAHLQRDGAAMIPILERAYREKAQGQPPPLLEAFLHP